MYLVILAFDNLNFRQWAVRYKAIRHIFLSLREDPPIFCRVCQNLIIFNLEIPFIYVRTLDVVFCQIEIVLKDSTAFVYVTKSEKSSHFTLMT